MTNRPKKAKVIPYFYDTECPHCGENIAAPSGSVFWRADELTGQKIKCNECFGWVVMPKL